MKFLGHTVKVKYAYDAKVDRWYIATSNIPGLCMEGDSKEEIEAELPEVLADMEDFQRERGGFP